MIISFGCLKKVGKTTALELLKRMDQRVVGISFAQEMKRVAHQLYGWAGLMYPDYYKGDNVGLKEVVLPKIGMSPREIWVRFGTEAVRDKVYQDTWVRLVEQRLKALEATEGMWSEGIAVIDDMRFQNEFDMVKSLGGLTVRIDRSSVEPALDAAEGELIDARWDRVMINDGSIQDFEKSLNKLLTAECARKELY